MKSPPLHILILPCLVILLTSAPVEVSADISSSDGTLLTAVSPQVSGDTLAVSASGIDALSRSEELFLIARAQYAAGAYDAAAETVAKLLEQDPRHEKGRLIEREVQAHLQADAWEKRGGSSRNEIRERLLEEVDRAWQRPRYFSASEVVDPLAEGEALADKLTDIRLPEVRFDGVPLLRVVEALSAASIDFDPDGRGVNLILLDPAQLNPGVHLQLRDLPLGRVLDFLVEATGFTYDIEPDAVVLRPADGPQARLETAFFPLSRSTLIRLTGPETEAPLSASVNDPWAEGGEGTAAGTPAETRLRNFLQRAGIPFDEVPGASLALAHDQLIVTQTPRHLDRIRNLLRRYHEVRQVEIETRFIEIQQGDLNELGFNWTVQQGGRTLFDQEGNPILTDTGEFAQRFDRTAQTANRSLNQTFGAQTLGSGVLIDGERVAENAAPRLTRALDLAAEVSDLASISGVLGEFEVDVLVRALSRESGNDLLSAPKVTVLSGKTAEIVVAQELRYPQRFSDIDAQVGVGESLDGSAGVAITAGTPQDFTVRNLGVEMRVTPTVENDSAISLILEPQVTEFEGFVEYGGPSVAIAAGRTVTVPSGFFQPIFAVRRIRTEVTIRDGATVVMGGLTREEAVSVSDKVPFLGDIPLLGRLFRSEGESSQKRNLLIFVTANLVNPGGVPARQAAGSMRPNGAFRNSSLLTPAGIIPREATP